MEVPDFFKFYFLCFQISERENHHAKSVIEIKGKCLKRRLAEKAWISTNDVKSNIIVNPGNKNKCNQGMIRRNLTNQSILLRPTERLIAEICKRHDVAIVGAEYILEFNDRIKCFLCGFIVVDMVDHLASQTHQAAFIQQHFPTAAEFCETFRTTYQDSKSLICPCNGVNTLIKFTCEKIESNCGRSEPLRINQNINDVDHQKISSLLSSLEHFSENNVPELKNMLNGDVLSSIVMDNLSEMCQPNQMSAKVKPKGNNNTLVISSSLQMKIAIQIAKGLLTNGIDPSPEQLDDLLKIFCDSAYASSDSEFESDNNMASASRNAGNCEQYDFTENLTEDDLKVLLENFESLKMDEQRNLIQHLKSLSETNPKQIDTLRAIDKYGILTE